VTLPQEFIVIGSELQFSSSSKLNSLQGISDRAVAAATKPFQPLQTNKKEKNPGRHFKRL
jgi:hypothetical protein